MTGCHGNGRTRAGVGGVAGCHDGGGELRRATLPGRGVCSRALHDSRGIRWRFSRIKNNDCPSFPNIRDINFSYVSK